MNDGMSQEQLMLFQKQLTWQELPKEVHEKVIDVAATMCVDIVTEVSSGNQEQHHESSDD